MHTAHASAPRGLHRLLAATGRGAYLPHAPLRAGANQRIVEEVSYTVISKVGLLSSNLFAGENNLKSHIGHPVGRSVKQSG
jgi:hypothetical protein